MMCGFIFGALAALALAKLAACGLRRRAYYRGGYGPWGGGCHGGHRRGWHHHGWHGGDGWDGDRGEEAGDGPRARGPGRKAALRWLFERLDTTPGQEKVILEAVDQIFEAAKQAKGEWRLSFGDVAKAMRGEEFGHDSVGDAWVRHDALFEKVRLSVVTALQHVHAALDDKQRKILSELLERGGGFGRMGDFI